MDWNKFILRIAYTAIASCMILVLWIGIAGELKAEECYTADDVMLKFERSKDAERHLSLEESLKLTYFIRSIGQTVRMHNSAIAVLSKQQPDKVFIIYYRNECALGGISIFTRYFMQALSVEF